MSIGENDLNLRKKIKYEGSLFKKTHLRAGYDIVMQDTIAIAPHEVAKYKTDVRFPNGLNGYFAIITIRSSYQNSGLSIPSNGGIGILDDDYTDYLFLNIKNETDTTKIINKQDRIAQLIFVPTSYPILELI